MHAFASLPARWNGLPRTARVVMSAVAVSIIFLTVAAAILTHPPRTSLFAAPLHPEQLSEVEERLASWNVPFTSTNENVIVDTGARNGVLLRLSLAGVPHPHLSSTAEALASIGALTPQAVIDAQTRAGLAGDIEAGLRGIDGVEDARVIVAPATAAEFADETAHAAGAGVRLTLRAGAHVSQATVDGIRAFVAASVPQLQPSHVTILDDRGIALGDARQNAAGDADELQSALQSALDDAFGDGAAIVRVHAEYAAERTSEHDLRRVPAGAFAIAGVRNSESYEGGGKRYRRLQQGEDRGSETHEVISEVQPGGLRRLSTAVFVDALRALDLAKVRELAAATVGYDVRRGDQLAVEAIDFHRAPVARIGRWSRIFNALVTVAPAVVLTLGLVLCVRLVVPPLLSLLHAALERSAADRTSKVAASIAPARVRSLLEREPPHAAAAIISALPAATATAVLEMYPPHERDAIVGRMARNQSPLLPDTQELLRTHA